MLNSLKAYVVGLAAAFLFLGLAFGAIPAHAVDSWPGDSGSLIADAASLGAGYEPSGLAYHSVRKQLVMVGDDGDITTMNTDGSSVHTKSPTGEDLEGVAVADATSDLIYVGIENPDSIKEYNLSTEAYTGKKWTLTAWLHGDDGQGLEALTFVPNGFHPYANSNSGGLFYAGHQLDGKIFVFDINTGTSEAVTLVDTITVDPALTDISGLDFNSDTQLIYAIFDTSNRLVEMQPDKTIINTYSLPSDTQEGIAVVTGCPTASAHVYIAEDFGPEVWAYGNYPITCHEDDDGNGGGDDDGGGGETETEYLGKNTVVSMPGPGGTSQVRTFNTTGRASYTTGWSAYAASLRTGFNVAAGDLNGDGEDEIVTSPRTGGAPRIRIFDKSGRAVFTPGFYAYDQNSRCGVDLTVGDLNGDGKAEIVTVPGAGCSAQVKIFNYIGQPIFTLGFFAYDKNLKTGFRVTAGDLNGDGKDEIITSPEKGAPAHIRVFNYLGEPRLTNGFYAYSSKLKTGADVTGADLDSDGRAEIVTVPGDGFPAQVRIFDSAGRVVLSPGFYAYSTAVKTGFSITAGDLNGDRKSEIVVAPKEKSPAHVRTFDYRGQVKINAGFFAYPQTWPLGADVAVGKF